MSTDFNQEDAKLALDKLIDLLDKLPEGAKFKQDVRHLKSILVDRRAPRLVVIGRRGHGKSSIANALLGFPYFVQGHVIDEPANEEWCHLTIEGKQLSWLDTSGIGAGGIVAERLDKLKTQVRQAFPDVILFAVKATEVDSEIDATLNGFKAILEELRVEGCSASVIALVTKVDELHPGREKEPLSYSKQKHELIEAAVARLLEHLERHKIAVKATIPISAYMEFSEPNKSIEFDGRWNVDRLGEVIFSRLPQEAIVEAARAFRSTKQLRQKVAQQIVKTASMIAFGVGMTPIPIADIAILVPLQITMVTAISYLSGRSFSERLILDWLASVGAVGVGGVSMRVAFQQLVKLIPLPIGAQALSGAIAGAGTWAIGMSAIAYFINDKSLDEAKEIFSSTSKDSTSWRSHSEESEE